MGVRVKQRSVLAPSLAAGNLANLAIHAWRTCGSFALYRRLSYKVHPIQLLLLL